MRRVAQVLGLGLALAGCAAEVPGGTAAPPVPREQALHDLMERLAVATPRRQEQARRELASLEDVTWRLSPTEQAAIAARLKECHSREDHQAAQAPVRLVAGFDAQGEVRQVVLADPDGPDATSPSPERRVWIRRLMHAVVMPKCNPLPLPPGVLGRPGRINLRFSP